MTEKYSIKKKSKSATSRSNRALLLFALPIVVVAVTTSALFWRETPTVPAVVTPEEFEALDPMVRSYVSGFLDKARATPRSAEVRATLGLVLAANELWEESGASFEAASRLDPRNLLARFYLGVVRQKLGDLKTAIALFEKVKEEFGGFPALHYRLGELRLKEGDLSRAAKEFQKVINSRPRSAYGYSGLAAVRVRQKDFQSAQSLVDSAIERAPNSLRARYLRGLVYRKLGRSNDAEKELRKGLGSSRNRMMSDPWSRALLDHNYGIQGRIRTAMEFSRAGKHQNAQIVLKQTLRYHPEEFHVLNNLGIAELSLDNPQKALEYLLRAERSGPRRPEAHLSLTAVYENLGELQKALKHARVAEALQPESSRPLLSRARLHAKLGQRSEALAALDEAMRHDPDNPKVAELRQRISGRENR